MLNQLTARNAAWLILAVSAMTIAGAWLFQWAGYAPCPLCLKQRWAYYAVIPLSLVIALVAGRRTRIARHALILVAVIMAASAVFGAYHAGIEWKFWPGPGTCEGTLSGGLPKLGNDPVIGCEDAALRIFGLSLAGWNAIISLALSAVALIGERRSG